jgi:hypothetical protein
LTKVNINVKSNPSKAESPMNKEAITIMKRSKKNDRTPVPHFFLAALFLLLPIVCPAVAEEFSTSAGPAFDRFHLTLEDGWRTEAAGPFYYSQTHDTETTRAWPPFFSCTRDSAVASHEDDFLYPVLTHIRYGQESRWQLGQLISFAGAQEQNGAAVKRFTLYPLYFQQRSTDTNLDYTAVLPFYGHLKNRLFHDEIFFVMFPFYAETHKRGVVTENYPYPFVATSHGDGLNGWQVWPFAGHEHKDLTTFTNGFGDLETVGGHDKSFFLWPLHLKQDTGIGTDDPEKFRASIPFYAYTRSPKFDTTTVLWPFFTWIDEREKKYREWEGPWPFVIFARGEGKTTSRVFPLFSRSHNASMESDAYLWPVYQYKRTHVDPLDQRRTRILYYLYSRLSEKNTETGAEKIRLDMWPFFTWHRDFKGNERLQVFAPVEPAVPDNPGIERNWSPLWSLWRTEANAKTGASSRSLLWNLYRCETAPAHKKVSLLFGLFQYQSDGGVARSKWFYVTGTATTPTGK